MHQITGNIMHWSFDSAADFYRAAIELSRNHDSYGAPTAFKLHRNPSVWFNWSGTETFAEAAELALNGWPKGREKILRSLEHAKAAMRPALVRAETLDVAGAYPFVPAAVAGDPACMWTTGDDDRATPPIVRIIAEQWVSMAVTRESQIVRGAAIAAHVDRLEAEGIRCEIVARYACSKGTRKGARHVVCDVMAKRADEPLELDRLIFLVAHPSALRRMFFGQLDHLPHGWNRSFCDPAGYGGPTKADARNFESTGATIIPSANEYVDAWTDEAAAVRMVGYLLRKNITRLGDLGVLTKAPVIVEADEDPEEAAD